MMKRMRCLALVGAALMLGACASKKPNLGKGPSPSDFARAAAAEKESGRLVSYVVKPGDSLWSIASRRSVLGDPFRWPLLYRQNRDQIQDPDLIEVRQDLSYHRHYSQAQVREALRLAGATPPYVKHSQPRKVLPLQY